MNLSRGFLKKFRTFLIISVTGSLLCLVPAPASALTTDPSRRDSWGLCFVSVSTVLGSCRSRGSPLDCNHYTTLLFSCQGVLENYFRFAWLGEIWLWPRGLRRSNSLTHKRLCFPHPLYLYYTTSKGICQEVFWGFLFYLCLAWFLFPSPPDIINYTTFAGKCK